MNSAAGNNELCHDTMISNNIQAKHQCKVVKDTDPKVISKQLGIRNFTVTPKTTKHKPSKLVKEPKKREPPTPPEKKKLPAKQLNMSQPKDMKENQTIDNPNGDNKDNQQPLPKLKEPELSPELQRLRELLKEDIKRCLLSHLRTQ